MRPPSHERGCANQTAVAREEHDLRARVEAEFRALPGLRLTRLQAARLFSMEPERCERVLGALVDAGVLTTDGQVFGRGIIAAEPHRIEQIVRTRLTAPSEWPSRRERATAAIPEPRARSGR